MTEIATVITILLFSIQIYFTIGLLFIAREISRKKENRTFKGFEILMLFVLWPCFIKD